MPPLPAKTKREKNQRDEKNIEMKKLEPVTSDRQDVNFDAGERRDTFGGRSRLFSIRQKFHGTLSGRLRITLTVVPISAALHVYGVSGGNRDVDM
jgi:hypothetical protein